VFRVLLAGIEDDDEEGGKSGVDMSERGAGKEKR
jgi:hypothetical protein